MSAEDCPFQIVRPERSDEDLKSNTYVKFEILIDPNNPDGLKSTVQFLKLNSDHPEDVLNHFCQFDKLVTDTGTAEGEARFRLFSLTLSPDAQSDWNDVLAERGDARDQDAFDNAKEAFLLTKVERDCAINTKEWLNNIKKPRSMTVKSFMQRIKHLNNLIGYMPLPEEDAEEADAIPSFNDAELRNILKKACPKSWKDIQVKSNVRFESSTAQVQYYEKLRNMEGNNNSNSRNGNNGGSSRRSSNNGSNGRRGSRNNRRDNRSNSSNYNQLDPNAICPIHGNHTVGQCRVIQQERDRYNNRRSNGGRNNSNSNSNRNRNSNNNQTQNFNNQGNRNNHGYNTRSNNNRGREENKAIQDNNTGSNPNAGSDSEYSYPIEEELNVLSEEQVEEAIAKASCVLDTSTPKKSRGCDVRVQLSTVDSSSKKIVVGLLDSGATSSFVVRSALKNVKHTIQKVNTKVKGRYGATILRDKATFKVKLPDFTSSKTIEVTTFVEEDDKVVGRHSIVFGSTFLEELGITLDYSRKVIVWDDVSTSMRSISTLEINSLNDEDPEDADLPPLMKMATKRAAIKPNAYDKYNYRDMVLKCNHLTHDQQNELISVFSGFEELFSGDLGKVPGPPVKLHLKPNSTPYCARSYTIPKSLERLARKEINDLVDIGVLVEIVDAEWLSPSFFRPKKDGRVRFVSDLRKLNRYLVRHPHPLPNIEDVIWKMNGFE